MFFQIRLALRNQHIFKHLSRDRHSADLCSLWTMFPSAHSAGIELIPHGEVEWPGQVSQGFRPKEAGEGGTGLGRNHCGKEAADEDFHACFLHQWLLSKFPVSMKWQSTEPKESEGRPSRSTMSCWGKDPSSITDYLIDFGKVVYHLWTS